VESSPDRWIAALRSSHDRLERLAGRLNGTALEASSYDDDWSIAQVLGHLGSQAEIFGRFLDAGLSGGDPPGQEDFLPIWQAWDARSPADKAADGLLADREMTQRFESLDAGQRARMRLTLFGMDLDTAGLARMRLAEHALHTWDIAVALDPAATLAPDATELLIDAYDERLVGRAAKPDGKHRRLALSTTSPERHFILETGEQVRLEVAEGRREPPDLRLPAEAFLRLVAGRLDPGHTPAGIAGAHHLDELRPIFPGF
jgi:uncharacterized protein (TIGR03083 family)